MEVSAAYEERVYFEVTLPRLRQAVGEMQESTMRDLLAGKAAPHASLREKVLKRLTREVMPAHLRYALAEREAAAEDAVEDPIPHMTPAVARAVVAFFKRPHPNAAWIPVWKDFDAIKRRAREEER